MSMALASTTNNTDNSLASDHLLHDRVGQALANQQYLPGKLLRFEASQGRVILHGHVRSFFHKQMAQETLRRVAGVQHIENRMTVEWTEQK